MGSVSVSVTAVAVPGPALDTVIVKPIRSPAETVPASGVLTTLMSGHWTTTAAVSESGSSLVASIVAVLSIVAQEAAVVGLLMCTVRVAPAGRSPKSHASTPAVIEQVAVARRPM